MIPIHVDEPYHQAMVSMHHNLQTVTHSFASTAHSILSHEAPESFDQTIGPSRSILQFCSDHNASLYTIVKVPNSKSRYTLSTSSRESLISCFWRLCVDMVARTHYVNVIVHSSPEYSPADLDRIDLVDPYHSYIILAAELVFPTGTSDVHIR